MGNLKDQRLGGKNDTFLFEVVCGAPCATLLFPACLLSLPLSQHYLDLLQSYDLRVCWGERDKGIIRVLGCISCLPLC